MTRTILLGAGASAEAGVPTAREMVRQVHEEASGSDQVRQAVNLAIGGLKYRRSVADEQPFEDIDVEDLYEALNLLARRTESFLAPFVGSWSSDVLAVDRGNARDAADNATRAIDQAISAGALSSGATSIRRGQRRDPVPSRDLWRLRRALEEGFSASGAQETSVFEIAAKHVLYVLVQRSWLQEPSKVKYFEPLVRSAQDAPLWIATLNYDNTVELAGKSLEIPVQTGLRRDGTVAVDSNGSSGLVTLAKLHGSVDWSYDDEGVLGQDGDPTGNPALIFGSGNKLQVEGPHLDLLFAFRDRLRITEELCVCGYSFRDRHVNHFVLEWLRGDPKRRLQVRDPQLTVGRIVSNMAKSLRPGWNLAAENLEKRLELRTTTMAAWAQELTTK